MVAMHLTPVLELVRARMPAVGLVMASGMNALHIHMARVKPNDLCVATV
jgi:hypothetical protein